MTNQIVGYSLTATGIMATLVIALFGFIVNMIRKFTKVEEHLSSVADNVGKLVEDIREDRRVNNERLTWLERSMFNRKA